MNGTFDGPVKVEWLINDPRKMRLLEDVVYTNLSGRTWVAFKDSIIDGASIPKFFWRVIGSPFIGYYRRASVIHDVYCVSHLRPHEEVHACFYEMMLQDGVPEHKAQTMYNAVTTFGPKW